MEDSKGHEQRPYETLVKRQIELEKKHPELKEMMMRDPLARAWMEAWIRSDKSIEDGLAELAIHLYKAKKQATDEHVKLLERCGCGASLGV